MSQVSICCRNDNIDEFSIVFFICDSEWKEITLIVDFWSQHCSVFSCNFRIDTICIVVFFAQECNRRLCDACIKLEIKVKHSSGRIECELCRSSLCLLHVWSCKCFDLPMLDSSILVIETFVFFWPKWDWIEIFTEGLELPVCPTCKLVITSGWNWSDFCSAGFFRKAVTELGDHEGYTKSSGILSSLGNSLGLELLAFICMFNRRFSTCLAHIFCQLAAVCMFIKNMPTWTDLTTWWCFKPDWED